MAKIARFRVNVPVTDRPLAAHGLISYRCRNRYGWTMIGAKDVESAMSEARRSASDAKRENLQVWNGTEYVPVDTRDLNQFDPIANEPDNGDRFY